MLLHFPGARCLGLFAMLLGCTFTVGPRGHAGAAESPRESRTEADPVTITFESLLKQSRDTEVNDVPRAIALAKEALALATRLPGSSSELRARTRLGEALRLASQYREARAVIDAGLGLPASTTNRPELAQLRFTSAQVHWNVGDYAPAEAAALAAQNEAEALGDRRLLIRAINLRGILARRQNDLELANRHLRTAFTMATASGDAELVAQARTNLANVLTDRGELSEARTLHAENLSYRTTQLDRRGQANTLLNLGSVEGKAGNHAAALDYYTRALVIRQELGVPRQIAAAQIALASSLTRLGRTEEALAQLGVASPAVEKVASHDLSNQLYVQFAATHTARAEFREALDFHLKAEAAHTAMVGAETARTIAELRERFDAEKLSRENSELRAEQQRNAATIALNEAYLKLDSRQRSGIAALLVLGAIAVTAVVSRLRDRSRAERLILDETLRARDAAEQADALKSQLLDLASHDLKAPLITVMHTADRLVDEAHDSAAVIHQARGLRRESQRLFDLVQNLLDTSALESGKQMLYTSPVDLAALVRETVPALDERLSRKNQHLVLETDTPCPMQGDAMRLRQVCENLVDNASKFSATGATVRVVVRPSPEHVRLEIHDQGPGLTEEDRANLFQRFRRLSARPTAGESSTGLGLALVRDLVTQHGGRIWAEPAPGGGSIFIAEFPAGSPTS